MEFSFHQFDLTRLVWMGLNKFQILFCWLVGIALLFVVLERLWQRRPQAIWRVGMRDDLALYFIGGIIPPALGVLVTTLCLWASASLMPKAWVGWLASWPLVLSFCFAMFCGELTYYWAHRLSHEIPWLWRFHSIHHNPSELDWLVNTRAHPLDLFFSHVIGGAPLIILGIKQPDSPVFAQLLFALVIFNVVWAFFVHSNCRLRFGWLEHLITTPAFHHWHHANDGPAVINKNYSAIFPWMDRLFGTHILPDHYPKTYGIAEQLPEGIGPLLWHPFKRRA